MISFGLTEDQEIAKSAISDFAMAELRPESRRLDAQGFIDDDTLAKLWSTGIVQSLVEQAGDEGNSSRMLNCLLLEELGAADASLAMALAATIGFVQAIAGQGSPGQREALLPGFAGPEPATAALAVMEPGFDFRLGQYQTTVRRDGTSFLISGRKAMVPLAARCGYFLVVAAGETGPEAFIVPAADKGVDIAAPRGTLGLRALAMSEVAFDDVAVPAEMRLGGDGGADVQRIVDAARVGLSSIMTGLSRAVLDHVIPYTKERVVHGSPLAQKQAIAFSVADMLVDIDAMRWMSWQAAWALDTGREATREAHLAYCFAGQRGMTTADNGVQAFGGHGFVRAEPLELWYRDMRSLSVLEGAAGV